MTSLEAEDAPVDRWRPDPPCPCDVARGECWCEDDGSTGEPREFEGRMPETITAPAWAPLPAVPAPRPR